MNGNLSNVETSIDTSAIKGRRCSFNLSNIANRFEVTLGKRVDTEVLEFPENHEKICYLLTENVANLFTHS